MTSTRRRCAALMLTLALAGCDDADLTQVTLVFRDTAYDRSHFTDPPMVAEVHNGPFPGISPEEVARMIALPASFNGDFGFRRAPPGTQPPARIRLALAFNSASPLSGEALCRRASEPGGRALGGPALYDDASYLVDLALCRDDAPVASASMKATARGPRDAAFVDRTLRHLMLALFGSAAEREDP